MVTRTTVWTAAMTVAIAAIGCEKGTSTDESSSSRAAPAPAPAPQTVTNTNARIANDPLANVANLDRVTMDPNARKIDPPKPATVVTGLTMVVRQSPGGSKIETIEAANAPLKEVQRAGDFFLVTYPDPKDSNKLRAGWVYRDDLAGEGAAPSPLESAPGAPRAAGTAKINCASGEAHLRTTQDFCGRTCSDDRDCDSSKNLICDGVALKVGDQRPSETHYCVSKGTR